MAKRSDETKNKTDKIQLRVTEFQKNRIKMLADKYAGGCVTTWMMHGALNAPRKFLAGKPADPKN